MTINGRLTTDSLKARSVEDGLPERMTGQGLVSWTLSIEMKFYVLAALLRPLLLKGRVWPLFLIAIVGLVANTLEGYKVISVSPQLVSETMYLGFIVIGTLFHFHYRELIRTRTLIGGGGVLLAIFFVGYFRGPTSGGAYTLRTASFRFALVAFTAGYVLRSRFRPNMVLDFLVSISYPLYLVHAVSGFAVISFLMMACKLPFWAAAPLTAGTAMAVAWMMHKWVEVPTTRLGRYIGKLGT